jgi:aspartate/tyrosine/aromatic aminotransferase
MFQTMEMAPPDAILGLTEAFKKDTNPNKINLSVGVYQDSSGKTPILDVVKQAETRLLKDEANKSYLGIDGLPEYGAQVRQLLFGASHPLLAAERAVTAQTPGGTGALRVAADFLKQRVGVDRIWCSKPTWANHPSVFKAAGLDVDSYPYLDEAGTGLDFEAMMSAINGIPAGDAICLHACCHNPTGVDPSVNQWREIGERLQQRGVLPLVDFAYQGFAEGLEEDAAGLRMLAELCPEMLICSSFSKNFGLYGERVGAMTAVADSADAARIVLSHVKICIRTNYSNPPKHGGAIVATVLADDQLRAKWIVELGEMRQRIHHMRQLFVDTLKAKGVERDFSFIPNQRGMFSFSGLTPVHVDALRNQYSIYIVGSGRINVAGMTESNMDTLCEAIKAVL